MEAIQGDKLRGHLEAMVLSTLERGEAHGLEILHRLEEAGCGLLRLKEGSLYPALYRLEAAGAVKAVWEAEAHGRPQTALCGIRADGSPPRRRRTDALTKGRGGPLMTGNRTTVIG